MKFVAWRGLYRQAVEGHSPWTPNTNDAQERRWPYKRCQFKQARRDIKAWIEEWA